MTTPFYVLVETVLSTNEPVYFDQMTGIGPACSPHFEKAEIFDTENEARLSPASSFLWAWFEPIPCTREDDVYEALTRPPLHTSPGLTGDPQ